MPTPQTRHSPADCTASSPPQSLPNQSYSLPHTLASVSKAVYKTTSVAGHRAHPFCLTGGGGGMNRTSMERAMMRIPKRAANLVEVRECLSLVLSVHREQTGAIGKTGQ